MCISFRPGGIHRKTTTRYKLYFNKPSHPTKGKQLEAVKAHTTRAQSYIGYLVYLAYMQNFKLLCIYHQIGGQMPTIHCFQAPQTTTSPLYVFHLSNFGYNACCTSGNLKQALFLLQGTRRCMTSLELKRCFTQLKFTAWKTRVIKSNSYAHPN